MLLLIIFAMVVDGLFAQQPIVIQSATIINSTEIENPVKNGTILIEDGKISAFGKAKEVEIPDNAHIIDATGKWVISGIIEVHTHSDTRDRFEQALALGITTAHTLPGIADTTLSIETWTSKPAVATPHIVQNSWMFSGSFPDNIAPGIWKVVKPSDKSEAVEKLEQVRKAGFREIKVFLDSGTLWFDTDKSAPNLSDNILQSLIQRAHQLRMRVYAHTWEAECYRKLLRFGVDNIIHPAADAELSNAVWQTMKSREMTWTATVSGLERLGNPEGYSHRRLDDPNLKEIMTAKAVKMAANDTANAPTPYIDLMPQVYSHVDKYRQTINKNTRLALEHGVTIAVGSDNPVGIGTHVEMEMLQEAGLTPAQVLKAATWGGAKTLALEDKTGSIEKGKRADLVILNSNPLEDIRNARDINATIKQGVVFYQDSLFQILSK